MEGVAAGGARAPLPAPRDPDGRRACPRGPIRARGASRSLRGGPGRPARPRGAHAGRPSGVGALSLRAWGQATARGVRSVGHPLQPLALRGLGTRGFDVGPGDRSRHRGPAFTPGRGGSGPTVFRARGNGRAAFFARTRAPNGLLALLDAQGSVREGGRRGSRDAARPIRGALHVGRARACPARGRRPWQCGAASPLQAREARSRPRLRRRPVP